MQKQKIAPLVQKLAIKNTKLVGKAEELVRMLDYYAPTGIHSGVGSKFRHKPEPHPFDREIACKMTGVDSSTYADAKAQVTAILKITLPVDLRKVGKELNCPDAVVDLAIKVLKRYKDLYLKSLPEARQNSVNFNLPSYSAASLALCAEFKKVKIQQKKLLQITDTRSSDYQTSYDSIDELIFAPMRAKEAAMMPKEEPKKGEKGKKGAKPKEQPSPPKKKSILNDALRLPSENLDIQAEQLIEFYGADDQGQPNLLPAVMQKTREKEEYLKWKEQCLAEPKLKAVKTQQTTLGFKAVSKEERKPMEIDHEEEDHEENEGEKENLDEKRRSPVKQKTPEKEPVRAPKRKRADDTEIQTKKQKTNS